MSRAEPGETIALVGSSGAGKSTIASLIPRLFDPDQGAVRIGGVDLREISAASLRQSVGMVTQDGQLFHETIRANLTLARPGATDQEIWEALTQAHLAHIISGLPHGLDTIAGERGYRLSGGERQRLTIARMLLARPQVVILDEATAHLDSSSEAEVQAALAQALSGLTAIIIAHRLATIRSADRILVIDDGEIVESGSHSELLHTGPRYQQLYQRRFGPASDSISPTLYP